MYIEKINGPKDVKALSIDQLPALSEEVRAAVLNRVSKHGGHVGPNLGFTEATIAMHYVFNAPEDKFIYDISHQSYPHKVLTGRKEGFLEEAKFDAVSGFSSPAESPEYDLFEIGHTSVSVSLASGMMKARDLLGGKENVVAVIGDGAMSGGEAFEGLDTVAELGTNAIIIFNDNEMSIAENHGGIYKGFRELRETKGQSQHNLFKAMGLDYLYVEEGNDVKKLVEVFQKVKDIDHPIVLHLHTEKGHGYQPATDQKEEFHYRMPFNMEDGSLKNTNNSPSVSADLHNWLFERAKNDPGMFIITSGVPTLLGFTADKRQALGKKFVDVGIAEEQAVAMASGAAKRGARPVYFTAATFLQRTYDQIAQDLSVNGNPAVINVWGSSIYGMNDYTHICFFDIPMLSHIPNLVYLAPTTTEETIAMEKWAVEQTQYSIAIRVPMFGYEHSEGDVDADYSQLNKYKVAHRGKKVAVIGVGDFYGKAKNVVKALAEKGIDATQINPRYLTGIDEEVLESRKPIMSWLPPSKMDPFTEAMERQWLVSMVLLM